MADERYEYGLRRRAVELHQQGNRPAAIAKALARSRFWVWKWLRAFATHGWAGLASRSRAPKRVPGRTKPNVVAAVLAARAELQAHRTRASRFSGIGAEVIRLQLQRRGIRRLPGLRTIERIVQTHGLSNAEAARPKGGRQPYPAPRARRPGDLQQTDLVGPRHLRGVRGHHTLLLAAHCGSGGQSGGNQPGTLQERRCAV